VLKASSLPRLAVATLGDSARVTVGSAVVAIGNRAGAGGPPAPAPGVISGIGRTIEASDGAAKFTETLRGLLATTARIEPGDSGGPLADAAGAVIGVDTAAGTGGAEAGYAIPIDAAMAAVRQILGYAHLGI
jgi:S1-C subfamily serine protease